MKMKGKALLSLVIVLTMMLQFFSFSAFATGSESLSYEVSAVDAFGQAADVSGLSYSVSVGSQIGDLMTSGLYITPPDGWYVQGAWINAGDGASGNSLPLTADANGSAAVSVDSEAFVLRYENGMPVFNDALLASMGGSYTLHVLFAELNPESPIEIRDAYGNVVSTDVITLPGDPGSDGSSRFVGWRLSYANGSSVLVQPNTNVYPYASCSYAAAYAACVTVRPSDMSANAGDSLSNLLAGANVEQYNLPAGVAVAGVQVSSNAPDPLQAGTYSLYVSARLVDGNYKDVDPTVAYLETSEGTLTVNEVYVPTPEPEPEPEPIYVPTPEPVNATVTLFNQSWVADGNYHQLDSTLYSVDGMPAGDVIVGIYAVDGSGSMIDPASAAPGQYTLYADCYYDTGLYNVSLIPATLTIEAPVVHEHTPGEAVHENETAATCTTDGSYEEVVYCSSCGEVLSREAKTIPATGHVAGETVRENEVPATCSAEGHYDEVVRCSVCGAEMSRNTVNTPTTDHTPGEAVHENEVAATCTEDGHYDEVVRCTVCGTELSRSTVSIPATGHVAGEAVRENEAAATCTEDGHYDEVVYCSVCGAEMSREQKTTPATDHNWGDWVVTKEATEEAEGEETRTCQNDPSHVETRSTPKKTHTHTFTKTERKEASYTAAGNIEYYTCSGCGKIFRDAEGLEEITLDDTVIPMLQAIEVTVTASNQSWTVGSGKSLDQSAYKAEGFVEGDTYSVKLVVKNYSDAKGEYPIEPQVSDYDTDKYHVTVVPGTLTLTPPDITNVTVSVKDQTMAYTGQAQALDQTAYTVEGLKDGDSLTVTLAALGADGSALSTVTNAGSYTIQASVTGVDTAKYNVTITNAGKLTVNPLPVTVTAVSESKAYTGSAQKSETVTAQLIAGHKLGEVSIAYFDSNNTRLADGPVATGSYTKKVTAVHIVDGSGADVTANYSPSFVDGTLTITPPETTPTPSPTPTPTPSAEPTPSPIVYLFVEAPASYQWTKGGTTGLTFKVNADIRKFASVKVDGAEIPESCYVVSSGSTVVTLNPNYLGALASTNHAISVEFTDGTAATTFTVLDAPAVTPIPLTITGRNVSKTYDGNPYNLSSYGQNSQGITTSFHLAQNGQTVAQAINPGTYDIYLDSLNFTNPSSQGYNITVIDSNGNTVALNYKNSSVRLGTLTITGSAVTNVTVTVKDQAWTYDGTAHTLNGSAYTVDGLRGSDTVNVALSIVDASGRTLSAVTDAGTYTIKANVTGYNAGTYNVTVANTGTLTVSPYKLTLTAESAVKNYDGSVLRNGNVKATALLSGHKFRSGDGVKFSVYDSRGNLIQNGPVEVGTYTKKVTDVHIVDANNVEVTANYSITRVDGTLTINNSDGSPKTADSNNMTLWVALLAISALLVLAIAALLLRRGKKKSKSKAQPKTDSRPQNKR